MISREHPSDRRRRYLRYAAVVLTVVLIISSIFFVMEKWEQRTGVYNKEAEVLSTTLSYEGKEYTVKDNMETILVVGLDKTSEEQDTSYNNSKQADFLMLVAIDNTAKTCSAIQINRDTMAQVNVLGVAGDVIDTVTKQIALSHTYGNGKEVSCRNTANSVSKLLLNTEIDHFVSLSLDSVPVFNDLVGGVTVEITDDFSEIDKNLVQGQQITLNGEQALEFIQSRYGVGDQSNNNRMARQRQYLKAFYEQFCQKAKNDSAFIKDVALKSADYIVSDCSVNRLEGYLNKITSHEFLGITVIDGESRLGEEYMEFYPDEASVKKTVIETFYQLKQ